MENNFESLNIPIGKELLPIGSIVKIENLEKLIMIYGRKQKQEGNERIWDYVSCPYPEGHLNNDTNIFFNHSSIITIIFKGLETEGEIALRNYIKEQDKKADKNA
ncbi:DUF4176 domain-containing protein [Bacillus mangrovi]|uniref:DUF4176 domain-containing protein n=1 Tax=Metabacillus mangrovi TaxID=1491830 RepID=A0A7X2V4S3_9BACI|nr:DUF4176 domain-containing protein [Metabacillus mangrovi]MTH53700.1 DUF4176 domain-containing protein [Metabacillus mangrovi]